MPLHLCSLRFWACKWDPLSSILLLSRVGWFSFFFFFFFFSFFFWGGCSFFIYIHSTKKKVDTFSTLIISYTNSIDGTSVIHVYHMKEKFFLYKNNCKLWPWNSCMTEHIHWTMTRSKIKNCKIAPKHSNQWENAMNGETCLSKESELLSKFMSPLTPPPPPPPHFRRIRGTFARSSSPESPYLVENVPPRSR